jgi:hypothetical protein
MARGLSRAEDILSSAEIELSSVHDFLSSRHALTPVDEEISRYKDAMKAEIEPLFSDSANQKTRDVINSVTALYDDLFDLAKSQRANEVVLREINSFIDHGMTKLVHNFSGYFDDEFKELQAFVSLLETRRNEAIWNGVFTFYFRFPVLSSAPTSLACDFIDRFWHSYLLDQDASQLGRPTPFYGARLSKIFFDQIYDAIRTDAGLKEYRNPDYIKLFERYSLVIAERSSNERREAIKLHLRVPTVEPGR